MNKKNNKFRSLILIILITSVAIVSIAPQRVYAGGNIKAYIAEKAEAEVEEIVLKNILTQTGYKVASQAEIDAIRANFRSKFQPIDFTTMSKMDDETLDKFYPGGHIQHAKDEEKVIGQIGIIIAPITQPLREFTDTLIDAFKTKIDPKKTSEKKWDVTKLGIPVVTANVDGDIRPNLTLWNVTDSRISQIDFYVDYYYTDSTYTNRYKSCLDYVYRYKDGTISSPTSIAVGSSPTAYKIITYTVNNVPVEDETKKFKDYLPYPHTASEITDTTKVPTEIAIPVKYNPDGTVEPISTPTYPATKVEPDADGFAKTGDATVVYTKPDVDTKTNTITDPSPAPKNITPDVNPTSGIPSLNVPDNAIPTLDFGPLMVATRKFPFCIPWDLADLINLLKAEAKCPVFKFDDMPVSVSGISVVVPGFTFDLSTVPGVDALLSITRFFELLTFVGFLIMKTRDLIRG